MLLHGSSFFVVLGVHFSYSKGLFPAFSRTFSYFVVLFILTVLSLLRIHDMCQGLWQLIWFHLQSQTGLRSPGSLHTIVGACFSFRTSFIWVFFVVLVILSYCLALCTIPFSSGCVLLRVFSLAFFYPAPLFSGLVLSGTLLIWLLFDENATFSSASLSPLSSKHGAQCPQKPQTY